MRLVTTDYLKTVDVGTGTIWYSLYSTVMVKIPENIRYKMPEAVTFLKDGECTQSKASSTAKQLKELRKELAEIAPTDALLDFKNPNKQVPWKGHISKDVTSCANLYTTADGKDLLLEVTALLEYAAKANQAVLSE